MADADAVESVWQVVKRETIELSTDENGLLTYTVTGNLTEAPFEVLCSPGQCYEDTVMVYAGECPGYAALAAAPWLLRPGWLMEWL